MDQRAGTGLVRGIRRWDLVAVAINAFIGAGIFGLPSKVFGFVGAYSLLPFWSAPRSLRSSFSASPRVGSRFRETGGSVPVRTRDARSGCRFRGGLADVAGAAHGVCGQLQPVDRIPELLLAARRLGGVAGGDHIRGRRLLTVINLVGVRDAARGQQLLHDRKLVSSCCLSRWGCFFVAPERFAIVATPSYGRFSKSVLLLVYAFTGFEMAVIPAGEVRDPQRDLPMALLTAIGVVAVL